MSRQILFLTLKVFSSTGGIEKVCRVAGKCLYEFGVENNIAVQICSMYDRNIDGDDNKYFPSEVFRGFGVAKIRFMYHALRNGLKSDVIIMSHINLLLAGWILKKIKPSIRIVLFAHGIEVWGKKKIYRRKMLHFCDEIIAVSGFTKNRMEIENGVSEKLVSVLNNCLDPFLPLPHNVKLRIDLKEKYGIKSSDKILFTLSRLSTRERYKGYDKVMQAMVNLPANIKYLIAGSYDETEKIHIASLIEELKLENRVILAGYIPDEEVAEHFVLSDCYVMPSIKEGFGIVFIEAMFYGKPVIAGNADGSVDALHNGELGLLVNPTSVGEIRIAIEMVLSGSLQFNGKLTLLKVFSYTSYKEKMCSLLERHLFINAACY